MNISDRYKLWKNRKNNSYHHGGRVDVLVESYNKGTLSDEETTELLGILEERSNTPLPDFNSFSKEFMDNAITSGMDTYIYSGIYDEETHTEKRDSDGRFMGQRTDDILGSVNPDGVTGELISEDYIVDGTTVDLAPVVTKTRQGFTAYTTRGEHMFDRNGNPVPTFKTKEELNDWLKTEVYKNPGRSSYIYDQTMVNVEGCGDNMTCITSATNNTVNMIKAWNIAIKDKNSPYYCPTCKPISDGDLRGTSDNLLTLSHSKFWGVDGGTKKGLVKQDIWEKAGFKQNRMYERDFYTDFGGDDEQLSSEAIVNFLQQQQYGNIMGVHGANYDHHGHDTPGHAIQYMGGAYLKIEDENGEYKNIPLNFDSEKDIQNSLNILDKYKGSYNLDNISFLTANDPTEFRPFQYFEENMGGMFSEGDYTDPGSRSVRFTTFEGGGGYQQNLDYLTDQQEIYKNIYGDLGGTNWGTNYQSLGSNDLMVNAVEKQKIIERNRTDGLGEVEKTEVESDKETETETSNERDYDIDYFDFVSESEGGEGFVPDEVESIFRVLNPFNWEFQRGAEVPRYEDGGYIKKDLKKFMNGLAKPPSYDHGGPHDPNIEASDVKSRLYPVQVIQYPYGHSSMNSGHIESRILGDYQGNNVTLPSSYVHVDDDGVTRTLKPGDEGTYVNAWVDGNRPVTFQRDDENPQHDNIRSAVIHLNDAQLNDYINGSFNTTASSGGLSDKTEGLGKLIYTITGGDLPFGDEGYNFVMNNCADRTCSSFNIDAKDTGKILELTTDPTNVFDYLINPESGFTIQEGSIKGNRVDRGNFLVDPNLSFFDIPKDILKDLIEIEKKGYTYEDVAKWDIKTLQEKLPSVGDQLEDILSSEIGSDQWEGVVNNLIGQVNIENLVNTLLDENNLSKINDIVESVKSGDLGDIDAGDALKLYIESTGANDQLEELGWLGDYMKWKYALNADIIQNTYQVGKFIYDAAGDVVNSVSDFFTEGTVTPFSDEKRPEISVGDRLWMEGRPHANLARGEWVNSYGSIMVGNPPRYVWRSPEDKGPNLIPPGDFSIPNNETNQLSDVDIQNIVDFINQQSTNDYKNGGNVSNLQNKLFL